ncbi:hypothetical protein ACJ41O_007447 [Fusarium nematophilum]
MTVAPMPAQDFRFETTETDEPACPALAPLCRPCNAVSQASLKKPTTTTPTQYFSGWRLGLAIAASAAALVTIINFLFLTIVRPRLDMSAAKQCSIWLHLGINILANVLLGAGNYTQQVLTAPTRQDIDRAHGRMQWLDVGVSSLHNLGTISTRRVAAWTALALSSLAIHLLCAAAPGVASFLLDLDIKNIFSPSISELWGRGFGQVSVDCLISFGNFEYIKGPTSMVLISNSPQLILSLLYAALNGMCTAMLVSVKWNSYGTKHERLRTTYPVGQQRETYRLSLPLSIFFVRLISYMDSQQLTEADFGITTCGYSPTAIIFTIALGSLILLTTVGASMRTLGPAAPPGGTCAAVVSAACHGPEGDEDAALDFVRWGIVLGGEHCAVTSWAAEPPEHGKWYQ